MKVPLPDQVSNSDASSLAGMNFLMIAIAIM
jgi:hypothetical protein